MRIQCVPSSHLGRLIAAVVDHWLEVLEVDVTQLVQPEAVERRRDEGEVVVTETLVAVRYGNGEPAQDPAVHHSEGVARLEGGGEL